ncbi:unnamed protein product [Victoria cruziana]
MASHSRFHSAVQAMKNIGIPPKTVKPVLRKLIELYDDNWALIEEESYRVLADAIFEQQDCQDEKSKEEGENVREGGSGGHERVLPRTRSCLRIEEPLSSLSNPTCHGPSSSSKKPLLQEPLLLRRQSRLRLEEPPSPPCQSSPPRLMYNECSSSKEPASEEEPLKRRSRLRREEVYDCKKPVSIDRVTNSNSLKRPKIEPSDVEPFLISSLNDPLAPSADRVLNDSGRATAPRRPSLPSVEDGNNPVKHSNPQIFHMPKIEPLVDDYPTVGVVVPLAVVHPSEYCANRLGGSLAAPTKMYEDDGVSINNENVHNSTVPTKRKERLNDPAPKDSLSYEIASTSSGEVKLAISCNCSHTNQDFHIPSLDVLMKLAEDRALKSYKIIGSSFSIMKLMKEVCQCFLELATGAGEQQNRVTTVTPKINMSTLRKDHILDAKHASLDLHGTLERVLPQIPQRVALNCIDGLRRKKMVDQKDIKYGNVRKRVLKSMEVGSSTDIVLALEDHSCSGIRPLHDVNDITKGEEKVRIPIINEVSSETYPPSFHYIPNNIVYQNAYVNFSLARIGDEDSCSGCFGDCVSGSIPCSCARETGGEYAYTLDGVVRKEFLDEAISIYRDTDKLQQFFCKECPLEKSKPDTSCKGHLVRRFIKECWSKCGCSKECGNRVVQRGITVKLQVFFTPEGKGWALRTFDPLPRGAFVCEYVGEILTNTELYSRNSQCSGDEKHHYPVLLDADWGSEGILKDEEALCLDATHYGNVARFINHRCFDANLVEIPVEIETPDHHYYHLAFFTTREVEALEELTWDYGIDFDDADHPIKAFQCQCGSRHCRDPKRRNRTKARALTIRNG